MFYIVESDSQIERLQKLGKLGGYVDVISSNNLVHPKLTSTVAVYIRPITSEQGFIIPVNHDEGFNVSKERVSDILKDYTVLYTLDKKNLLYHFNLQHATDLSLLYSMTQYNKLEIPFQNKTINQFYNKHSQFSNINQLIPISILYSRCETNYNFLESLFSVPLPSGFDFYNNIATNVFFLLEQSGLGIKYDEFVETFKPREPRYSIQNNIVLTQYNLYNATSRPTNAFNSVNFAAIPKDPEYRKCFLPKGDMFVEFDFDGYHLRLLSDQIHYPLTEESAHKQLARLYFEKDEITDEEYVEAKQINFQALYGKLPEKHKDLKIFKDIQNFIDGIWENYSKNGVVYDPISNKPFTKELKDMYPTKLMNYMMQSLETSRNILILKEVLRFLRDKKTDVVLYTYDSLLLDFHKADGKETLEEIQKILETGKKYPVNFKFAKDLVL